MIEEGLKYYYLARQNIDDCDYEMAKKNLEKSINLNPHFKSYEQLSQVYKKVGNDKQAENMIAKAYQQNSNNDKTAFLYAKSLIEKGDILLAKQILGTIISRNNTYKPALELSNKINQ